MTRLPAPAAAILLAVSTAACAIKPASPTADAHLTEHKVLFATLSAVTCPSVGRCVAVGDFLPYDRDAAQGDPDGDGQATHTLAETFDGKGWKIVTSPGEGRGGADLTGVSCPGRDDCVAVGFYRPAKLSALATSAPPSHPLAELYNGRSWRIMPSPAVPPNSILTSVSCPSVRTCLAVGYTTTTGHGGSSESLFLERYAGGSWAVVPISAPAGTSSGLNSVACTGESDCVAVGNIAMADNPITTRPIIEVLANGTWTAAALPAAVDGRGILYDVSCASAGHCTAVGTTEAAHSTGSALVLASSGATWAVDTAALAAAGDNSLTAVGCDTPTDCYATGTSWATLDSGRQNIVVGLPGWRPLGSPSRAGNIESVNCPGPDRCVAVGSLRRNTFGNTTALVADFSEITWDPQSTPVP